MSVVGEISAAMQLMKAALRLHGAKTDFSSKDGKVRVESLSTFRVAFFLSVQVLVRASVLG